MTTTSSASPLSVPWSPTIVLDHSASSSTTTVSPSVMEVLQRFAPAYQEHRSCTHFEAQVLQKILDCRSGELGWHLYHCGQCGHLEPAANRCNNRHCPECTQPGCRNWLERVSSWSLPVNYLHLVFTLPHCLNQLIATNPLLLKLLFTVVRKLLLHIAKTHYSCTPGFIIVLHTWGQKTLRHVHVHVLMTSGGLSLDQTKWISMYDTDEPLQEYKLARQFRAAYVDGLRKLFEAGKLPMPPGMQWIATRVDLDLWLRRCYRHSWMVDVKGAPDGYQGAGAALNYLARYAKASAIKDSRIVSMTETHVTMHIMDYRLGCERDITISGFEFVRRFALHFLPRSIARLRYCGLFHPPGRSERLDVCRAVLESTRALGR